jgi:hypothetical protein
MQVYVASKPIWESKLVLLGVIEALAGLTVLLTEYLAFLDAGEAVGLTFLIKGLLTVSLRVVGTIKPVSLSGGDLVAVEGSSTPVREPQPVE